MINLLYKEFKLVLFPAIYFFLIFGAFLLIPSWPFFIAFGYIMIAFMTMFFIGRGEQDVLFTVSLPIRKRDVVRARFYTVMTMEILMIIVAIPFAIIHTLMYAKGNESGMNPNIAFFGFVFVMYAIFNAIFLPMFYKTAYKVGLPIFLGSLGAIVYATAIELVVNTVPVLKTSLDAIGAGHLESQLLVLIAGIGLFLLITRLASRKAIKNFEKVNL